MHRTNTTVEGQAWYSKVRSEYERTENMGVKYSTEFKKQAVMRVAEGGETSAAVARELGINANSLRDWLKTYKENKRQPFVGSGNLRDIDAENRRLRKQMRDMVEEIEILKKAAAIFARELKISSDS